ncbi:MAG: RagB/SusD family nutrient uptake outer membrane protein [Muribaculaceae bacterium]|nr:RagB/SusD family nutrient uptake outer membrane protein [Muribaculaceae bacterium]
MKIKKYLKYALSLVTAGTLGSGLTGCSSDYLDLSPITTVDSSTVSSSLEGARLGLNGMCRAMYCQYSNWDGYMFVNGESWMAMFYGDILGSDYYSYFWKDRMGNSNYNWNQMNMRNGWMTGLVWNYCYNLINEANNILNGIDEATGNEQQLHFVKAQVLTIRAHAYVRLLQIYAPRWEDSKEGSQYCVVIRTGLEGTDTPLVTMNDVLKVIYDDLDMAIELYNESGQKRTYNWEPNINVAQGIYARAALLKHDYTTAQKMAHDARQGFPIMSAEEYKSGFSEANGEWMWNNTAKNELYYWGAYCLNGCNCAYPLLWGLGSGAINYDLYRQMDEKDIRRDLFWTPDKPLERVKPSDFWNDKVVNSASMNMNSLNRYMIRSIMAFGTKAVPNGDVSKWGYPYTPRESGDGISSDVVITFGSQYKFWSPDQYGAGAFPFMRGAEMLLAEAEAAYYNNDLSTARANLVELNSKRIEGYTCTSTGQELLDEIRLSRRLELWGEGHCWFDLKRWNLPSERRAWVNGDPESNNIPDANAITFAPNVLTGWRFNVPLSESQFNHAIDRTLLGFTSEASDVNNPPAAEEEDNNGGESAPVPTLVRLTDFIK